MDMWVCLNMGYTATDIAIWMGERIHWNWVVAYFQINPLNFKHMYRILPWSKHGVFSHERGWSSPYFHRIYNLYTHYKDSQYGMDDHKPYTMFWPWHIWNIVSNSYRTGDVPYIIWFNYDCCSLSSGDQTWFAGKSPRFSSMIFPFFNLHWVQGFFRLPCLITDGK